MANMTGMDIAAVRALARDLDGQAAQLDHILAGVNALVGRGPGIWKGPHFDQFQDAWQHRHRPALQSCAERIHDLAGAASNNATEQEHVSGGTGAGSAPGSPVAPGSIMVGGVLLGAGAPTLGYVQELQQLIHRLEKVDKAMTLLPLVGVPLTGVVGHLGGDAKVGLYLARLSALGRARGALVTRHLLGLPVSRQLAGGLGGKTTALREAFGEATRGGASAGLGISVAVGAIDTGVSAHEYGWGDARTIGEEVKTAYVAGATVVAGPLGNFVADTTWTVGTQVAQAGDEYFHTSENAVNDQMMRAYGTIDVTPAQATDLVKRYSGPLGIVHASTDAVRSTADSFSLGATGGLKRVASWF